MKLSRYTHSLTYVCPREDPQHDIPCMKLIYCLSLFRKQWLPDRYAYWLPEHKRQTPTASAQKQKNRDVYVYRQTDRHLYLNINGRHCTQTKISDVYVYRQTDRHPYLNINGGPQWPLHRNKISVACTYAGGQTDKNPCLNTKGQAQLPLQTMSNVRHIGNQLLARSRWLRRA